MNFWDGETQLTDVHKELWNCIDGAFIQPLINSSIKKMLWQYHCAVKCGREVFNPILWVQLKALLLSNYYNNMSTKYNELLQFLNNLYQWWTECSFRLIMGFVKSATFENYLTGNLYFSEIALSSIDHVHYVSELE